MEVVARVATAAAGQIVRSPWLWLGIAGSFVTVVIEGRPAYPGALIGGWPLPAEIGLFIARYVVVGRTRIDPSQRSPRPPGSQTTGYLLAGCVVALGVGVMRLMNAYVCLEFIDVFGGWRAHPLELVQVVTALLFMAAVAVAAARWWLHPAVSIVVLLVVMLT